MSHTRLHSHRNTAEVNRAFQTGVLSPKMLAHLKRVNVATLAKRLPRSVTEITLTPAFLVLDPGKLAGIFNALPKHVTTVNFDMRLLPEKQYNAALNALGHIAWAHDLHTMNFKWDFNRHPMATLNEKLDSNGISRKLAMVQLSGPGLTQADEAVFKTKLKRTTLLVVQSEPPQPEAGMRA